MTQVFAHVSAIMRQGKTLTATSAIAYWIMHASRIMPLKRADHAATRTYSAAVTDMRGIRCWNHMQCKHGSIKPSGARDGLHTPCREVLPASHKSPYPHFSSEFSKNPQRAPQPPLPVDPLLHSRAPPVLPHLPYS